MAMRHLQIGVSQIDRLAAARREGAVARMCALIRREFALRVSPLADDQLTELVARAIQQADCHDFKTDLDLFRYLCICVCFGWDFHQRAELSWMQTMLEDSQVSNPSDRMARLYQACLRRLEINVCNVREHQAFMEDSRQRNTEKDYDAG